MADMTKLDEGWHYIGVSADKKSIVKYTYVVKDSVGSHVASTIVAPNDDIEYELVFERTNTEINESVLKMRIIAHVLNNGSKTNKKIEIETELEALNALQVIDKGTKLSPSIALAFRADERPLGKEVVAAITMVLDVSGSMDKKLNNGTAQHESEKRITKVKNALNGYTYQGNKVEGMINEFAKEDNIEIAIVPFARSGNYPDPRAANTSNVFKHPFYSVSKSEDQKNNLINAVKALEAEDGTNTGDGMRQAYYRNINFKSDNASAKGYSSSANIRNYMIILVDGVTTMATADGKNKYKTEDGAVKTMSWDDTESLNFDHVGIIGHGSVSQPNTENYVKAIGALVKAANIKVYVIGYAPNITSGINLIANETGAIKVYNYSENMNLDEIFSEIKVNIMEDIWHISGPQIQN